MKLFYRHCRDFRLNEQNPPPPPRRPPLTTPESSFIAINTIFSEQQQNHDTSFPSSNPHQCHLQSQTAKWWCLTNTFVFLDLNQHHLKWWITEWRFQTLNSSTVFNNQQQIDATNPHFVDIVALKKLMMTTTPPRGNHHRHHAMLAGRHGGCT